MFYRDLEREEIDRICAETLDGRFGLAVHVGRRVRITAVETGDSAGDRVVWTNAGPDRTQNTQ